MYNKQASQPSYSVSAARSATEGTTLRFYCSDTHRIIPSSTHHQAEKFPSNKATRYWLNARLFFQKKIINKIAVLERERYAKEEEVMEGKEGGDDESSLRISLEKKKRISLGRKEGKLSVFSNSFLHRTVNLFRS